MESPEYIIFICTYAFKGLNLCWVPNKDPMEPDIVPSMKLSNSFEGNKIPTHETISNP